jgi:hypothetical protein
MSLRPRHVRRVLNRIARKNDGFVPHLLVLQTDLRRFEDNFRRYGYHQSIYKDAYERNGEGWCYP